MIQILYESEYNPKTETFLQFEQRMFKEVLTLTEINYEYNENCKNSLWLRGKPSKGEQT